MIITQHYSLIKKCKSCHEELTDENWYPSRRSKKYYMCKNCIRENILTTKDINNNPMHIKCHKRKHTYICELCNHLVPITVYHHWDNEHPENGVWVCRLCHDFCEQIELGVHEVQYLKLKNKIESGKI